MISRTHFADDLIVNVAVLCLASAWQAATWRFVITEALGEEYCRRFGTLPYSVVTDGVEPTAVVPGPRTTGQLRVYFMGLLHLAYEANFLALLDALDDARSARRPTASRPDMQMWVTASAPHCATVTSMSCRLTRKTQLPPIFAKQISSICRSLSG